mmetsp:Transcript_10850/g.14185  ORF Transcript_10850/g.14185 Transcript_10850/m.14185 type:complete len:263 (+) Transcript_10850:1015-1803(+)
MQRGSMINLVAEGLETCNFVTVFMICCKRYERQKGRCHRTYRQRILHLELVPLDWKVRAVLPGLRQKKLAQQQGEIGLKAMQDRAKRNQEGRSDLFKNAMGEEISFILEKGSGKRAFALASRKCDNGIIDADFGVFFMRRLEYRDREVPKVKKLKTDTKFKVTNSSMPPFLINNISRTQQEMNLGKIDMSEKVGHVDESDTEEAPENLLTPERRVIVQDLYSKELSRQKALLGQVMPVLVSDSNNYSDDDDEHKGELHWEDG